MALKLSLLIIMERLLKYLFPLLSMTTSATTRSFILKTIISDVKNANAKTQNHKFNRLVQGLLYDMVERSSSISGNLAAPVNYSGAGTKKRATSSTFLPAREENAGKEAMWAVKVASELWRKGLWRDARTANLMSAACFHSNTKVQSSVMHFFLDASSSKGLEGNSDSDSDSEADAPGAMTKIRKVKHQQLINKKKRSNERSAKKDIKKANNKRKASELKQAEGTAGQVDNSALNLLHDPQTFAENLYELLVKNDKRFTLEHKVLIMQLFGRLTGLHRLTVLPFYSYINKYLAYHQLQITTILVALASSVHELVPPDALTPVIRKLAHEFVHPGVSSQVIAAGLNAIREICRRQPWTMEPDLLEDLVEYRKSKDKGVLTASRALLQLYRTVNPEMLRKRERGKTATMSASAGNTVKALEFGRERDAQTTFEGLDLLEKYLEEKKMEQSLGSGEGKQAGGRIEGEPPGEEKDEEVKENEEEEEDGWDIDSSASEDSSDDEGWIAVSSDEENDQGVTYFDDSEDEDTRLDRRAKKRARSSQAPLVEADTNEDKVLQADKLEVTKEEIRLLEGEKENVESRLSLAATKVSYCVASTGQLKVYMLNG